MNDTAVDLVCARLERTEEGFRALPYDDATGKTVRAPVGHVTWLYGINLETSGTPELGDVVTRYLIGKEESHLMQYQWYLQTDTVRQSVLLDIAYNAGDLLHFPKMLAAFLVKDWPAAATECDVTNPELKSRYANFQRIILSGQP